LAAAGTASAHDANGIVVLIRDRKNLGIDDRITPILPAPDLYARLCRPEALTVFSILDDRWGGKCSRQPRRVVPASPFAKPSVKYVQPQQTAWLHLQSLPDNACTSPATPGAMPTNGPTHAIAQVLIAGPIEVFA